MTRELTYREAIREFLFFLKKENAYKKYIKAIKRQKKEEFKNLENYINVLTIYPLKTCFKNDMICYLIDRSFTWVYTEEGHGFWAELDRKWYLKMEGTKIVAEKLTKNNNNIS